MAKKAQIFRENDSIINFVKIKSWQLPIQSVPTRHHFVGYVDAVIKNYIGTNARMKPNNLTTISKNVKFYNILLIVIFIIINVQQSELRNQLFG